jgi:hypothetical protein
MTQIEHDTTQAPPNHTDSHPAVITDDSARQGPNGRRVLYVLMAGLGAISLGFSALYIFTHVYGA